MCTNLPLAFLLLAASASLCSQEYTVIHDFETPVTDGTDPSGPIAQSRGGEMLGAATGLEEENYISSGFAFRIWPDGPYQALHDFSPDGPIGGLSLAKDGLFYGTDSSSRSVFKMTSNGSLKNLIYFYNVTGGDFWYPTAAPIQSIRGDYLYGTSLDLGGPTAGIVYKITKYGDFTVLHSFSGTDGSDPDRLVQGTDFYFYGTTFWGGTYDEGTIFRISASGDFKVLLSFDGTPARNPTSGLIQANDGNFYGECVYGGLSDSGNPFGFGSLFRVTPTGKLTVLHEFTGSDGTWPWGGLVQASDGNLYGVTEYGGKNNVGVLFRATLDGQVVVAHDFADGPGSSPAGSLIQHTNGRLYGIAAAGGKFENGVFFSFDAYLPPFVTYLPTYGRAGASVEILGQNFTSGSQVSFNGRLAASPDFVSPNYLRVTVPSGATTGPITVTTANRKLTSNKAFIVHKD
jgi:uncharacterized repeat protein (TIGR03803 family)